MDNEMAFFPLKLVAFPEEDLNLHIFEPRYKQMIQDCLASGERFGICTFLDKLMMIGTEVELVEISNTYEDGRMDVRTKGKRPFKVLTFLNPIREKLYAGGTVSFLPLSFDCSRQKHQIYQALLENLYQLMNQPLDLNSKTLNSFTYAHKIGLKTAQEYELLGLGTEDERLDFLIEHFNTLIPVIKELESSKHKIKMNGHFKYLDPLNF